MEVYESIIVKVIVMLDEVEYDIIYNQKDKDLIYEDLSNIIKIAIDTKDLFLNILWSKTKDCFRGSQIRWSKQDFWGVNWVYS